MKFAAQKEILHSPCKHKKLQLILISETLRYISYQRTFLDRTGCKMMLY